MGKHYILEDGTGIGNYTIMISYIDEDESGETPDEVVAILTGVARSYAEKFKNGCQIEYDKDKKKRYDDFIKDYNKLSWIEKLFGVER